MRKLIPYSPGLVLLLLAIAFALSSRDADEVVHGQQQPAFEQPRTDAAVGVRGTHRSSSRKNKDGASTISQAKVGQSAEEPLTKDDLFARAIENAKRPVPKHLSDTARELWKLRQRERVVMLEMQRDSDDDPHQYGEKRRLWKKENADLYARRKELREIEQKQRMQEVIAHAKPEEASLLKLMNSLHESMNNREISQEEYRAEITLAQNQWKTLHQQDRSLQNQNYESPKTQPKPTK